MHSYPTAIHLNVCQPATWRQATTANGQLLHTYLIDLPCPAPVGHCHPCCGRCSHVRYSPPHYCGQGPSAIRMQQPLADQHQDWQKRHSTVHCRHTATHDLNDRYCKKQTTRWCAGPKHSQGHMAHQHCTAIMAAATHSEHQQLTSA